MKKLVFFLAVFTAAPAFALDVTLTITPQPCGGESGQITIQYKDADPCNLPRIFALDLTIDSPGQFTAISGYKTDGESNSANPGYGIYPARMVFDEEGDITSYGDPRALDEDPGTTDQEFNTSHIVLELASLYYGDVNAPNTSGTLCVLDYSCSGGSDLDIVMTDEIAYRGGVVLEDGTQHDVCDVWVVCEALSGCLKATAPEYADWVLWDCPACWCYKRHCRGDADGIMIGPFWVNSTDLAILKAAFNKQDAALAAIPNGICADFDHTKTGPFRVGALDLNKFKIPFNKMQTLVPCCDNNQDCVLDAGDKFNFWTN